MVFLFDSSISSAVKYRKRIGDSVDPWGIPDMTAIGAETFSPNFIVVVLSDRKDAM